MSARSLIGAEFKVVGKSKVTISTATTISFSFGSPADINLAALAAYKPGDRIVVIFDVSTTGSTNTVSFSVQDAPDNNGAIGTPSTASTDAASGAALSGGNGDRYAVAGVQLQQARPWLRCQVTSNGATGTFIAQCLVLTIPAGL